jgi:hypothetical protein
MLTYTTLDAELLEIKVPKNSRARHLSAIIHMQKARFFLYIMKSITDTVNWLIVKCSML